MPLEIVRLLFRSQDSLRLEGRSKFPAGKTAVSTRESPWHGTCVRISPDGTDDVDFSFRDCRAVRGLDWVPGHDRR